jgi:LysM repeat protein
MKMVGYFLGAFLALLIAGFLTVIIFPAWADQLLGMATESSSVQNFQEKTQELIDQSLGQPTARPPATVPTSPVSTPSDNITKPGVAPAQGQRTHVVQSGDTLYNLSHKYGVSVQEIQKANNIANANEIQLGQTLIIP